MKNKLNKHKKGAKEMRNYKSYIGKTFQVKGFTDLRTVKIVDVYLLGGQKRYPAFKCEIIKSVFPDSIGERENLLAKEIVKDGALRSVIKVLSR